MRTYLSIFIVTLIFGIGVCFGQERAPRTAPKTSGDYVTDVTTLRDAQAEAVGRAQDALEQTEDQSVRTALETAIKEMKKAQSALDAAKDSPDKLTPALAAEQA